MAKLTQSNRLLILPVMIVLILGLVFQTAILPMVKSDPKDVPIGLVVEDEGEMGATLTEALQENAPDLLEFTQFDSVKDASSAMDERDIYGTFVVPADFSEKVGTLQTDTPEKAKAQIYINEGANAQAAMLVQTALTNMVDGLNTKLSTQMLTTVQAETDEMKEKLEPVLQAEGEDSPLAQVGALISPIEPSQVQDFATPIELEVIEVNETGDLDNAPIAFFTVTWFASLIGAVVLYLRGNQQPFATKADKLKFNTFQSVLPFVYALIAGYVATWYSTWLLGFDLENFNHVALYIALCVSAFTFMIFATLRWLKLPSVVIYVLLMFFSMASLQLAPEMMPAFYRDYIYSWLPIRIYSDGLKDILFFGNGIINRYSTPLIWILVVAFVAVWIKNLVERPKLKEY